MIKDRGTLAGLALLAIGVFALQHAPFAGLHADDHSFHSVLATADWSAVWSQFKAYAAGSNFYILYYAALYKAFGPSPISLHLAGLALDLFNGLLVYALLCRMRLRASWAFAAAALFLVFPNHGETHYWTAAIAMNLVSTALLLLSLLALGSKRLGAGGRLALAAALWALALFDCGQAFLMWLPLVYFADRLAPPPRPSRRALAAFAAVALALDAAHLLLGRPTVHPGGLLYNAPYSLYAAVKLLPPRWDALRSVLGGAWPTALAALAAGAFWLRVVARLERDPEPEPAGRPILAFAALWFCCAYVPSWFGSIEPRHNYLPSLGTFVALVVLAFSAPRRLRPLLAAAGLAAISLSTASTLSQGYAWSESERLHASFRRWAIALLGRRADNVFVVGAPRLVLGAPSFDWPGEPAYLFEEASGRLPDRGDVQVAPARSGVFHGNQPELFGESLWFTPYSRLNLLVHSLGSFSCARRLVALPPGSEPVTLRLPGGTRCRAAPRLEAPVWLLSASAAAPSGPGVSAPNGAELVRARLTEASGWANLELVWRAAKPVADFASMIRLLDERGRAVYRSVYESAFAGQRERGALWPAFNDLYPPARWPAGRGAAERYRLRLDAPLPAGPLRLELTVFERTAARWRRLGAVRLPVERP